jgi:hypothetical protein
VSRASRWLLIIALAVLLLMFVWAVGVNHGTN